MKPYDKAEKCPKCGGNDICDSYQAAGHWASIGTCCDECGEHIHRHCRNCGYWWNVATLDAKALKGGE